MISFYDNAKNKITPIQKETGSILFKNKKENDILNLSKKNDVNTIKIIIDLICDNNNFSQEEKMALYFGSIGFDEEHNLKINQDNLADLLLRAGLPEFKIIANVYTKSDFLYHTHFMYEEGVMEKTTITKVLRSKADFGCEFEDIGPEKGESSMYYDTLEDAIKYGISKPDHITYVNVPAIEVEEYKANLEKENEERGR